MHLCKRIFLLALLTLALFAGPAVPDSGPADFEDGETFVYQVSWGIFSYAGLAVITAERLPGSRGEDLIRLLQDIEARGVVGRFYPLDTRSLTVLESDTGRILWRREVGYDGRNGVDSEIIFDYVGRRAVFFDRLRPERNRMVEMPAGEDPTDLIAALIQASHWNLRMGEEQDVLVYASRDVYPLTITAEGYEEVRTPSGSYRALVLVPRMRTEPKGIFERGGEIKVWIAEGGDPLPVRMQLILGARIITLNLLSHDPGR